LKQRREPVVPGDQEDSEKVTVKLRSALGGGMLDADVDLAVVRRNKATLTELRSRPANIADDAVEVDAHDQTRLSDVIKPRGPVDQVVGKHLTFIFEAERPPTGTPVVVGSVHAREVWGSEATRLDVEEMTAGSRRGEVDVDAAGSGSKLSEARFGRVGPGPPHKE